MVPDGAPRQSEATMDHVLGLHHANSRIRKAEVVYPWSGDN